MLDHLGKKRPATMLLYEWVEGRTDDFDEENRIVDYEYCSLYRGDVKEQITHRKIPLTVKVWDVSRMDCCDNPRGHALQMLMDEVLLLQNGFITSHPSIPEVCDYFLEDEHIGVIYEFETVDTVYNLLPKDEFNWLQRIKVAVGIASLLNFFHDQEKYVLKDPFLVRNLDASRILITKEGNPKLCDLSMLTGGIIQSMRSCQSQNVDAASANPTYDPQGEWTEKTLTFDMTGEWTEKTDVYAFGVLLLNLMAKRVYTDVEISSSVPSYYEWTQEAEKINKADTTGIKRPKFSLVDKSLEADPCFYVTDGPEITKLAIQCMEYHPEDRPTMKEVVNCLQKLEIVQRHSDVLCNL